MPRASEFKPAPQNALQKKVQMEAAKLGVDVAKSIAVMVRDICEMSIEERECFLDLKEAVTEDEKLARGRRWLRADSRLSRRVRSARGVMDVVQKALGPVEDYDGGNTGKLGMLVEEMQREGKTAGDIGRMLIEMEALKLQPAKKKI